MCAFHTYDKLVFSLRGRGDRTGCVRFTANNFIRARREKHKSFGALVLKSLENLAKWFLRDWCLEKR